MGLINIFEPPPLTRRYLIKENVFNSGWPLTHLKKCQYGQFLALDQITRMWEHSGIDL